MPLRTSTTSRRSRFLHLRGHYAFHATACTPETPREKGSVEAAVRYLKSGFWPARCFATLTELERQYADWRDGRANVRASSMRRGLAAAERRVRGGCARNIPAAGAGAMADLTTLKAARCNAFACAAPVRRMDTLGEDLRSIIRVG